MDYTNHIKAIQQYAGVEADGVASSKTWIAIYHLLFSAVPYDLNISSIIKAVQQKIVVRVNGQASPKLWDALHHYIVHNKLTQSTGCIDPHNEIILQSMTKEMVPFAKELIRMAASAGIHIRLMCGVADDAIDERPSYNVEFGLVFDVGIYERTASGGYIYKDSSPLYEAVAKLGESIGLTWINEKKTFSSAPHFELRPAWAVRMKEIDMLQELSRRKKENINLLAIL